MGGCAACDKPAARRCRRLPEVRLSASDGPAATARGACAGRKSALATECSTEGVEESGLAASGRARRRALASVDGPAPPPEAKAAKHMLSGVYGLCTNTHLLAPSRRRSPQQALPLSPTRAGERACFTTRPPRPLSAPGRPPQLAAPRLP